ncbi:MAG TPA: DUF2652 domain-containing protein [Bacteroidota bacterium]|nr:DUF2652 domain-containing protein [Bacteroidota bacterium]
MAQTELEHAQGIMSALFNALIGRLTPAMTLAELEGDALFLYTPAQKMTRGEMLMELIESAYLDFRKRRLSMSRNVTCPCLACQSIDTLDLKFVAHYGEFAIQDFTGKAKPIGSSVNLVHRLLKNNVREAKGWHGYALFTKEALESMDIYPVNTFEQVQNYEHFGDVVTFSSDLDERFRELTEAQSRYMPREEADVWRTYRLDAPPGIVWDYLNDPAKRTSWMKGSAWQSEERPKGRTGRGAKNHCTNSNVIEHVLDWRPFDYYTVRVQRGAVTAIQTSELTTDSDGTNLEWRFMLEGPLPKILRAPLGKFIALRLMAWDACASELARCIAGRVDSEPG